MHEMLGQQSEEGHQVQEVRVRQAAAES